LISIAVAFGGAPYFSWSKSKFVSPSQHRSIITCA